MITLDMLVEERRARGKQGFLSAFGSPVLVRSVPPREPEEDDDDDSGFHTEVHDRKALRATMKLNRRTIQMRTIAPPAPPPTHSGDVTVVHPIRKRPGGPFKDRIGVGRSADVTIALPAMSKYHAFFTPGSPYTLTDAESKNGTYVGGARLTPGAPRALSDGDEIRFGPYPFTFRTPEGLLELVEARI